MDTVRWAVRERSVLPMARSMAKAPLVMRAERRLHDLSRVTVPELLRTIGSPGLTIPPATTEHHGWQIGAVEQALLAEVARCTGARSAFELGTFDGGTTLALARAIGPDGIVHTIDLSDEAFERTQSPSAFTSKDIGRAYRQAAGEPLAEIVQHRGDTTAFDFSEWAGSIDLVLVDGAHDHDHGVADSATALALARSGGWIFWDDVDAYWHGLVDGILSTVGPDRLTKIARTSLAFTRIP